MTPFNKFKSIRAVNRFSVARTLRKINRYSDEEETILVTTVPNACDYVDSAAADKVVYYCVDDFSEWPGLDKEGILAMEDELIRKSDLFIATSKKLYERLSLTGKPTFLLTHGVDLDIFSSEATRELESLAGIPAPRACYFGLFDERTDQDLFLSLAQSLSSVSFVIAGKIEASIKELERLPNVHFLGFVPYEKLPLLVAGMQLLLLPYRVNKLSESLSPLKLKEYLATGLPVISSPISAALEYKDLITIASGFEDWQSCISEALQQTAGDRKDKILKTLSGESWSGKSSQFLVFCEG